MLAFVYRLALIAYPPAFRVRFSAEMTEGFRALVSQHFQRGFLHGCFISVLAVADTVREGLRERSRVSTRRRIGMMTWLWTVGQDVRLALRGMQNAPGFTVAAIAVLAIGIGANGALFGTIRSTLMGAVPYEDSHRLVVLNLTSRRADTDPQLGPWSYPKYEILAEAPDRPVEELGGFARRFLTLTGSGDPTQLGVEVVTGGYFATLGIEASLGRVFDPSDSGSEQPLAVAVLSDGLWRERYGADPQIIGRAVFLNGRPLDVIGIAPPGFRGLTGVARAWISVPDALELISPVLGRPLAHWMWVVGRLPEDVSVEEAAARMVAIGERAEEVYPGGSNPDEVVQATAVSLSEAQMNPNARLSLVLLGVASMLVLIITCANLAGLLLARARRRARDAAVRLALGAGRTRLIRAQLTEAVVLSLAGAAAGVAIAFWGVDLIAGAWPDTFMEGQGSSVRFAAGETIAADGFVVLFSIVVALLTAATFGTLPALVATRGNVSQTIRDGTAASGRRRGLADPRSLLVTAQVALALVLVVGASLMTSSLGRLQDVDRGFRAEGLLAFKFALPRGHPADPSVFQDDLARRVASIPGIHGAALGGIPGDGHSWITGVRGIDARPIAEGRQIPIGFHQVTDDYFDVLGSRLLRGRRIDKRDRRDSHPALVINERAASAIWGDQDALGRTLSLWIDATSDSVYAEVVGIVEDILYNTPAGGVMPEAYISHRQEATGLGLWTVRTTGDPLEAVPAIRAELARLDPDLPIFSVMTVSDLDQRGTQDSQVIQVLLSVFALVAILLAATGTYGVIAHAVAYRRGEFGLRMALGAESGDVLRLVARQGISISALGVLLGVAVSLVVTRFLRSMLFEVGASDPKSYAVAILTLGLVAAAAVYFPARRATTVAPMEVLKSD